MLNQADRARDAEQRTGPSPGLRPPSPRFAGRGALDIERPSPRARGEGGAKRRMRGETKAKKCPAAARASRDGAGPSWCDPRLIRVQRSVVDAGRRLRRAFL